VLIRADRSKKDPRSLRRDAILLIVIRADGLANSKIDFDGITGRPGCAHVNARKQRRRTKMRFLLIRPVFDGHDPTPAAVGLALAPDGKLSSCRPIRSSDDRQAVRR
jgi:hypothetical protein